MQSCYLKNTLKKLTEAFFRIRSSGKSKDLLAGKISVEDKKE
jgi:hypothetical protein